MHEPEIYKSKLTAKHQDEITELSSPASSSVYTFQCLHLKQDSGIPALTLGLRFGLTPSGTALQPSYSNPIFPLENQVPDCKKQTSKQRFTLRKEKT